MQLKKEPKEDRAKNWLNISKIALLLARAIKILHDTLF